MYSSSNMMTDRIQRAISHLYGILYRINFYYSKKIFPIFCFDGRDSDMKRVITKDMLNDFRVIKKWYNNAISSNNKILARQIAESKEFLWPNIINESKQLLNSLGVPYIESPSSAESQCAYLVKEKIADYSNSHDFDSLLFGSPYIVQNLSKSLKRKIQGKWVYKKVFTLLIDLKKNLELLNINQFQLIDLAILIGTDYFPGIKGIGPKTALELIKKYDNIETILMQRNKKFDFSFLTDKILASVRKIFLLPEVVSNFNLMQWTPPNKAKVLELLCEDHNLNKNRVENNLEKVMLNYIECCKNFEQSNYNPRFIQKTLDMNY